MKKETTYYENGNVESIIERNDEGQLHGEYKWFYPNGQLQGHSHWKNDKRHGEYKWFYENGQLERYSFWKNGKCHGEYKWFYENGQLLEHSFWKNGKRHGETKWFNENGKLEEHSFWKNGKLHGETKWFYENGQLRAIVQYDNNIGLGKYFEKNGDIWLCKWNEWWIEKRIMLLKGDK